MFWSFVFWFPFFISMTGLLWCMVIGVKESLIVEWGMFFFFEWGGDVVFLFDSFSLTFLFVVGLVSTFVLIYSNVYMEGSVFKKKFVLILFIFIVSMFFLCFSADLFWVMVGWDGLGFSSFCLIFFFQNWKSFNNSMVTFLSNRVGDFCMITFIVLSFVFFGVSWSWSFEKLGICSLLLLVAAFSKSSQVPFSAWLPLAMAAPTPVSSLVHSSTLVTAGVFLLIRFSLLVESMGWMIFLISGVTIILACVSSVGENDLKKVIALSTLSHVGLMMMFVSMGSFVSAEIHLVIHAFFKSLLFMVSGMVIHSIGNSQDVRDLSVISSNLMFSLTFILSSLSMMGAPFLAGFYSKEVLLGQVFWELEGLEKGLVFFFSLGATCSYSVRMILMLSESGLYRLSFVGDKVGWMFFFMSLMSSFFSGLMVFLLVEKSEVESLTFFSYYEKMGLLIWMVFGVFMGMMFSFFFSSFSSFFIKVSCSMWMMGSLGLMLQKEVFFFSFFFLYKSDVKGFLDYLFESLKAVEGKLSFFFLGLFIDGCLIVFKFFSVLMLVYLVIWFFVNKSSVLNLEFSNGE